MLRKTWWAASLGLAALIGLGCGETDTTGVEDGDGGLAPVEVTDAPAPELPPVADETTLESATPPEDAAPADDAAPAEEEATTDGATAAADIELSEDEVAAIQKLPAEDVVLALAQKVCPISGEPLGSMDTPIKIAAGDTAFFVCCDGCTEEAKADPKAALAKLKAK